MPSNSCPFALQKDPFCSPKGFVLQPKRTPFQNDSETFQNDSETQLSVGGVSVKTQTMRAESPMTSTAQGNALGEKGILNLTPCKGNSLWLNRVALTGRLGYYHPYTQGAALGYVLLPLRGVLLRLLARHPPTFVAFSPYHRHLLKHAFGSNTSSSAK